MERIFFKICSLISIAILMLTGCMNDEKAQVKKTLLVDVTPVKSSGIPIVRQYIGITKSVSAVEIRARVQGFLTEKHFKEGEHVKKEQLLYVIDPKPFIAKLDHAKAVLQANEAERDFQAIEYIRFKKLVSQGNVAKVRFDKVKAQLEEAKANVALAKADIEQAELNLSYCYMKAPFSGRAGEKMVDVGNLVGGTEKTLLTNVVKLNPIYVEFSPSVSDFAEFLEYRQNMPFKVEAKLPKDDKLVFKGEVDLINNQANILTSTILMRAKIENPEKLILPGIYLNVYLIISPQTDKLLIPAEAVMDFQGRETVYIVNKDNKVELRVITTDGAYKGQSIIKSGLKQGEQLIVSNLQKIKPGITVTINQDKK